MMKLSHLHEQRAVKGGFVIRKPPMLMKWGD